MIEIHDENLFGGVVADCLKAVDTNGSLPTGEKIRMVNAIAKATVRIQSSGAFMDFDREADKLLIWSDSNEIYEIKADGVCQCKAHFNGHVCWHRVAKRILSRYLLAEQIDTRVEELRATAQLEVA